MNKEVELTAHDHAQVPQWWRTQEEDIQKYIDNNILLGSVKLLSISPGKRRVRAMYYGNADPELRGTANFNSALGSGKPEMYFRRGRGIRKRPVLVILAGVHGQEMEGMLAALSIINIMESGMDIEGKEQPQLHEKLKKLRLIVIPLANPDGRARVPHDGWVGLSSEEMTKYGQGTRKNGELYRWRGSMGVHPMQGDVGILGGYFDDAGVNLMHDEWYSPMSTTTKALLELVGEEGPDMLLNLHSCEHDPGICPERYIPVSAKVTLSHLVDKIAGAFHKAGLPYSENQESMLGEDGPVGEIPPSFNLNSMFFHAGSNLCLTFESPHGIIENKNRYRYSDLLAINQLLISTVCDYLVETCLD